LFVRVLNTGILPIGQEKAIQSNVSASIVFKSDVSKINQGTEFVAEVTVKTQK
jgi:hypothetical protein